MSKPALGRGLASLLQEEIDRGAVNAPGLTSLKEAPVAQPVPVPAVVSVATPIAFSTQVPAEVPIPNPTQVASIGTADQPVSEQEIFLPQTVSAEAIKPVPLAPVGVSNPPSPALATPPGVATIPGWIIPTLMAGDLVVVLSAILWAAWGCRPLCRGELSGHRGIVSGSVRNQSGFRPILRTPSHCCRTRSWNPRPLC